MPINQFSNSLLEKLGRQKLAQLVRDIERICPSRLQNVTNCLDPVKGGEFETVKNRSGKRTLKLLDYETSVKTTVKVSAETPVKIYSEPHRGVNLARIWPCVPKFPNTGPTGQYVPP
jgi:hypothetical protein